MVLSCTNPQINRFETASGTRNTSSRSLRLVAPTCRPLWDFQFTDKHLLTKLVQLGFTNHELNRFSFGLQPGKLPKLVLLGYKAQESKWSTFGSQVDIIIRVVLLSYMYYTGTEPVHLQFASGETKYTHAAGPTWLTPSQCPGLGLQQVATTIGWDFVETDA